MFLLPNVQRHTCPFLKLRGLTTNSSDGQRTRFLGRGKMATGSLNYKRSPRKGGYAVAKGGILEIFKSKGIFWVDPPLAITEK